MKVQIRDKFLDAYKEIGDSGETSPSFKDKKEYTVHGMEMRDDDGTGYVVLKTEGAYLRWVNSYHIRVTDEG